ncbi:exodeoxyribonuclease V subunit gamma [Vibrio sp. SS-MA-C1-2]|uniref:exodeoxyribonuclease V subunit gamma n=1 Tax=Vibrio sp. SS-MA-C1-2 TaxID=2908646 RepID=UPI001F1A0545|nr:exodeoxyribonuclease V subunit gamma [Vibrio sp. SS-MA-C1-2]UJF18927.1 exodeoxyribonuclease V subunit gamma [Vibrio sp. SS-MA-C1-2]
MFSIYHSNQLDLLKSLLIELIRREPLSHPLGNEVILVQSPGMAQWLKLALAKEMGIAANIEFPLPATFIWNMFTEVLPEIPERSFFNKESMTWKLMEILPKYLEQPEFVALANYLHDADDDAKRYQLAEQIADIFDQYLVYRPEWIDNWEQQHPEQLPLDLEAEQQWQPILWHALYQYTDTLGQKLDHRANLYQNFIDQLMLKRDHGETLPERIFIFGISALPPRYLDALKALGECIDVHLMFTNPCRYYWGDIRDQKYLDKLAAKARKKVVWQDNQSQIIGSEPQLKKGDNQVDLHNQQSELIGNSLLASMGKLGRDNIQLLSELDAQELDAFVDIEQNSLLHSIHYDILNLQDPPSINAALQTGNQALLRREIVKNDRSIQIHQCHSPMREVEVLYDNLLALLDSNPEIEPRDILVMVANIDHYSPAIRAVFSNAPSHRYIPFAISDQTTEASNPLLIAFFKLLNLPNLRCSAPELLELLEVPAVMAKFNFSETEFVKAREWVEQAGIRWGLDQGTAESFDLPAQKQNSWLFGLQRMLLGYALPQEIGLYQGMSSFESVQGLDAEIAGKLADFIEQLMTSRETLATKMSAKQWQSAINNMLDQMLLVDGDDESLLFTIREKLHQLAETITGSGYQQSISLPIILDYFHGKLGQAKVSQRFLAGQINFCTLMPMRSIPFKAVCLLGMNDGVYPRTVAPVGFDLMVNRGKAGDRSRRDDDRYLFLEAMLAAQDYFYISYIGRSIQDNSEKVPSVLVTELLEYCQHSFYLQGDRELEIEQAGDKLLDEISTSHSLTPYSRDSFLHGSYAQEWLPVALGEGEQSDPFYHSALSQQELNFETIDLVELQRFWRLPVQYFFNRRLKIYFDNQQNELIDAEPFSLDQLEGYWLRNELLVSLLGQKDRIKIENDIYQQHVAAGTLPIGSFSQLALEQELKKVSPLLERLEPLCHSPKEDLEVRVELQIEHDDQIQLVTLEGWLTGHFSDGLVRSRVGNIRGQDLLSGWIDHLMLYACYSESELATRVIGKDKCYRFDPIGSEQAKSILTELVTEMIKGHSAPLAYLPKTAFAGITQHYDKHGNWLDDEKTIIKVQKKMQDTFNPSYLSEGEGSNSYIQRVWPEFDQSCYQQVLAYGITLIKPMYEWAKLEK